MSWNPKSLNDLPHVLVGPMLRLVTPTEVNVFIVTKADFQVQLKVFEYVPNPSNNSTIVATGTFENMVKLGDNLFVKVVRVKNINPVLDRSKTYGYNIYFKDPSNNVYGLESNNILKLSSSGLGIVSYANFEFIINSATLTLPTFVLPPLEIGNLRVLHGSCRKPHGEGLDAMNDISPILIDSFTSQTNKRPHMLFLTGDQIYADDVSPIIFHLIDAYANLLLDWDELIPGNLTHSVSNGERSSVINEVAKLSVDKADAGSHLIKLREFIIMYVLVWSDVLWTENMSTNDIDAVLPSLNQVFPVEPNKHQKKYNDHVVYLNNFFQGISANGMSIRKAFANIPTYMILDDHEITDDLFFNEQWINDVIGSFSYNGSLLGTRICTSGLTAYAIFQDWGNKPDDYNPGAPGGFLLSAMTNISNNPIIASNWTTLEGIVLPELYISSTPHRLIHKAGGLNWHYYYEIENSYEIIVIDTRTMRVFNSNAPGLMSNEALDLQIAQPTGPGVNSTKTKKQCIIVSPTPVIGVNKMDRGKEFADALKTKTYLDLEHWSVDRQAYEHFFSTLLRRHPATNQLQIILLGGDVHYGYSNRMEYWASQAYLESYTNRSMVIASLCASSFKNEKSASSFTEKTMELINNGTTSRCFSPYTIGDLGGRTASNCIYGLQNLNNENTSVEIPIKPGTNNRRHVYMGNKSPAIFDRNLEFKSNGEIQDPGLPDIVYPNFDWHYRIDVIKSNPPTNHQPNSLSGFTLEKYKQYTDEHLSYANAGARLGRYIAGENNLGDITFQTNQTTLIKVIHTLWWWNEDNRTLFTGKENGEILAPLGFPISIFEIDMAFSQQPPMNQ